MTITYKSTCRSVLEYASPIWSPAISDTNMEKLQTIQNMALKTATGCLNMTHFEHVHQETKVLPLKQHTEMIAQQYLASTYLPTHPHFFPRNQNTFTNKACMQNFRVLAQKLWICTRPPNAVMGFVTAPLGANFSDITKELFHEVRVSRPYYCNDRYI